MEGERDGKQNLTAPCRAPLLTEKDKPEDTGAFTVTEAHSCRSQSQLGVQTTFMKTVPEHKSKGQANPEESCRSHMVEGKS